MKLNKNSNTKSTKNNSEAGIATIEYALLLSLLVMLVYAVLNWVGLKNAIQNVINDVIAKIS